ncbi:MAG: ubiquinol-cytochrome C chaperone family protein [Alphaproteobacteria bacterium]|jgi:cytochrome b pre-mRNA-processing protein 3|nr:ubiquinol-cytochrome C chaperone [Roseomonas sp.]
MGLLSALRRPPHERAGFTLYGAAVAAARAPYFYADLGVRDSVEGRLDLIHLHAALLVRRLRRDADQRGPALAQAVFDAMFSDMDVNLREMGVSDLVVGKRVRGLWEAFHGRATAYETALDEADQAAMADALARNVWREEEAGPTALRLARIAFAQADYLQTQDFARLLAGEAQFLAPEAIGDAA